jgi:deoxyribodipyrimidine photo-lyase
VIDPSTVGTSWEEQTVRMEKKVFQNSFVSELAWREFWRHIYHYFPESRQVAFQEKRRAIRRQNNENWFAARQEGRTGYPIVDA